MKTKIRLENAKGKKIAELKKTNVMVSDGMIQNYDSYEDFKVTQKKCE